MAIRKRSPTSEGAIHGATEQYFPECLPIATTILLRPGTSRQGGEPSSYNRKFVLELIDPLRNKSVRVGDCEQLLARDISAPLEYLLQIRPTNPLTGFLLPSTETRDEGLKWLEPYQPGKIPVVFVHGLLSDSSTWMDMVNDLRTQDWFNEHYQVWGFSYATGSPFVASALRLREQLREIRRVVDPEAQDAALSQMVLVGHSMGGLVAKLQVADSGDQIWNSVSQVPLNSIDATEGIKANLRQRLYFTPQPFIRRVLYIATPHAGSSIAARGVGRVSASLVRSDREQQARHRQLIQENPDAFIGIFRKRIPTSIDLLDPSNCTLRAIHGLAVPDRVAQHSIVGTGKRLMSFTDSDGVVSIDSASYPASVSVHHVAAAHTEITREPLTILEVARILRLHLDQMNHPCTASDPPQEHSLTLAGIDKSSEPAFKPSSTLQCSH